MVKKLCELNCYLKLILLIFFCIWFYSMIFLYHIIFVQSAITSNQWSRDLALFSLANKRMIYTNQSFEVERINKDKYLWSEYFHNQTSPQNDRIFEQREWITYLSKNESLMNKIQVKRILVFTSDIPKVKSGIAVNASYFDARLNSTIANHCPRNLMEKCNFYVKWCKDKNFKRIRTEAYDAIFTGVNCVEKREQEIFANMSASILNFYHCKESPVSPFIPPNVSLNFGNKILISYSKNADISIPYGKWVADSSKNLISSAINGNLQNNAEGKTKLVAMLVSNCRPRNNRLHYATLLQKYIKVDIYGKCGEKKCSKDFQTCLETLKQYKFYLAFENANCRDYVTEKIFRNAFRNNIVPIVMGAHPDDYKAIVPKNSYIHVENFESPEGLAKYLNVLDKNDTLYNEYFQWKNTGIFVHTDEDLFCRICAMALYADFQPQPLRPPKSTYKTVNTCLPYNKWYWMKDG